MIALADAVRLLLDEPKMNADVQRSCLATWSILHGCAHLAIQGTGEFLEPTSYPSGADLARMLAKGIRD